ncbi:hypothetical protein GCM10023340_41660 [Nocardioides marinquilinus]|uniref:DUF1707 domain-containing protein n=1 Tax=Nocardioides marinquilinus TaxID=1210400 RepID=A0ABP9Q733_9ACTN
MTELRVGDAERDRAAAELGEHYAVGRLTTDEHAERLDAVWTARTQGDLDVVFHDLPTAEATPMRRDGPAGPVRGPRGWRPVPFLPLLAVLIVASVLTGWPVWIAIFFVGCGLFSRSRHRYRAA